MNEHKYNRRDFFNPTKSDAQEKLETIKSEISSFILMNKDALTAADYIFVTGLLKKLKNQKINYTRQVLRSMQSKFYKVRDRYQRQ